MNNELSKELGRPDIKNILIKENKKSELQLILSTMDVPEGRKNDLPWLKRNLAIRNRVHPEFGRAMELIVDAESEMRCHMMFDGNPEAQK